MKEKKFLQKTAGRPARWLMATGLALTLALGLCVTGGISNRITAYAEEEEASGSLGSNVTGTITGNATDGYTLTVSGSGEMKYDTDGWRNEYEANITTVVIEKGITDIGTSSFRGFTKLASVTIPSTVTGIGNMAFEDCTSLTGIVIPDGVTSIGQKAFYGCEALASVTIPSTVTDIGAYAFRMCKALAEITIPSGVTCIEDGTFYYCEKLTNIIIPSGVTSIGSDAFGYCELLRDITFQEDSQLQSIGSSAFSGCDGLTDIEIPSGVTSIGASAFSSCDGLTAIEIPSGVTSIEEKTFYHCSNLTDIEIPSGVTSIGSYAFEYCERLTNITIPSGVTSIGSSAFEFCSALTAVTMPCDFINSTTDIFDNNAITYTYLHSGEEYSYKKNADDSTKHDKVYACCGTIIENTTENHTGGSYSATGNKLTESCSVCNAELGTATITCAGGNYNGASYEATVEATGTLASKYFSITYKEKVGEEWDEWGELHMRQASIRLPLPWGMGKRQ